MSGKFDQLVATFRRYATLIEQALTSTASATTPPAFTPTAESATALQIERGVVRRDALLAAPSSPSLTERLIHVSTVDRLRPLAIVDRAGHHRPVYRPLLAYAWLAAFRIRYETLTREQFGRWDEALRASADVLESELQQVTPAEAVGIPSSRGARAA